MREAARRKDEFLASLGHELRNPLAPIRTSVSLLTHMYPDAAPVARIRDMVERQVRLLTRLVDDPAGRGPHHQRQDQAATRSWSR